MNVSFADSVRKNLNGFDPATDIISEKYEAGPYLMYDCVDKHWVCVMDSFYKECSVKRSKEVIDKKPDLSCAPIGRFPGKKACFQRQLYLTTHNHGSRFCLHEDVQRLQIKFSQY